MVALGTQHTLPKCRAKKARKRLLNQNKRHTPDEFSDDSDPDDDAATNNNNKKKKKRKKSTEHDDDAARHSKLRLLKKKLYEPSKLAPYVRELVPPPSPPPPEHELDALRRQLRLRVPPQRTRTCAFWRRGECRRGSACAFAHADVGAADASPCPPPIQSVSDPALPRIVGRALLHLRIAEPSPVQAQVWSAMLAGRDVLCRAPTGSGKTLAYLLPALAHVRAQLKLPPAGSGPRVLVLVPTRELAMQGFSVAQSVRKVSGLRSAAIYGGGSREEQLQLLEDVVAITFATTGRLVDLLASQSIQLSQVTLFVIDEADLLVGLGFAAQATSICGQMRPDKQTAIFSATFAKGLEEAAASWARDPVRIYSEVDDAIADIRRPSDGTVGELERELHGGPRDEEAGISSLPASIRERFVHCRDGGRREPLLALLRELGVCGAPPADLVGGRPARQPLVMVFVNATKSMRPLLALLKRAAVRASALHGKLEQREREEALASFKSAKTPVLLCSDLVARGLDVRQLDAVINFDLPATMEQYVHRSGRTGRSGASGLVITLLRPGPDAEAFARGVARLRSRAGTAVPSELDELLAARAESAARPGDGPEAPDGPQDPEPDAAERAQMSLLDFAAAMA